MSTNKISNVSVILLAGGTGSRMGADIPKQYLTLAGKPIARHSFDLFASVPEVSEIVIVCSDEYRSYFPASSSKKILFALPGSRRQDSVFNGLAKIANDAQLVCVHDSARPLVSLETVKNVIAAAAEQGAAVAAVPLAFTVKQSDDEGFVSQTLDRSRLWEIQTPQVMSPSLLRQGFELANKQNITVTDCASLLELIPHPVKLIHGNSSNLKITTPTDRKVAEALLCKKSNV